MHNIRIIEASQHVEYGICFTYVCKKLVAESFSFAGTFDETCDIYYLNCSRYDSLRIAELLQYFKTFVRYDRGSDVRFYCTEREIGALCLP